jgi:hypothetical protein
LGERWIQAAYGVANAIGLSVEVGYRLLREITRLQTSPLLSRQAVHVLGTNQDFSTRKVQEVLGWKPRVGLHVRPHGDDRLAAGRGRSLDDFDKGSALSATTRTHSGFGFNSPQIIRPRAAGMGARISNPNLSPGRSRSSRPYSQLDM